MPDGELEDVQEIVEVRAANDASNSEKLAALRKEEKLLILIGVFLFFGTRRVTQKKISALKAVINHLEFDSEVIPHRDPADDDLRLAETTVWVLDVLRANFADGSALPEEQVEPLVREVTRSLDKDLKREPNPEEKASRIVAGLEKLATLDGEPSKNEKDLIAAIKSESKFIAGKSWRIFGSIVLVGSIVSLNAIFDDGSLIFGLAVFVAVCLSALKWITQLLSRALI